MAISPIGRTPPPSQPPPQPRNNVPAKPASPVSAPQGAQTHHLIDEDVGLVPTYSVIRIDESNRVSVKVVNAQTDEVVLEYPPASLAELGDLLRQAAEPKINWRA